MPRPKKQQSRQGEGQDETIPINAVSRAFVVLEALAERRHYNLERLAERTGLAKPTALRFLKTLCELGYVVRDDNDRYFLSLKMFSVGSKAIDRLDIYSVAHPLAQRLSDKLGETIHLGIRDQNEALYVLKIESRYTLRMYSQVGRRIPLYCSAIGKCILAGDDAEELERYFSSTALTPFTPKTIVTREELEHELAGIRQQNFAMDNEEHEAGIICIGAPIRDWSGEVRAALSVAWPKFRFPAQDPAAAKLMIQESAVEISRILGWQAG